MPILSRVGTGLFLKSAGGGGGSAEPGEAVFHADKTTQIATFSAFSTYTWTVPEGVTEISVVCIGGGGSGCPQHDGESGSGGGLAYKNNIAVTPGSTISVTVGGGGGNLSWGSNGNHGENSWIVVDGVAYAIAGGGRAGAPMGANGYFDNSNMGSPQSQPSDRYDGGGRGGAGYEQSGCRQSGGGCGGYSNSADNGNSAQGGQCGNPSYAGTNATGGTLGAGGGGMSNNGSTAYYASGGGGTGIYGRGSNGSAGGNGFNDELTPVGKGGSYDPWTYETNGLTVNAYTNTTGLRGYSNGSPWNTFAWSGNSNEIDPSSPNGYRRANDTQGQGSTRPDGGFPGGGGGGGNGGSAAGFGGHGCVRIVWGTINGMKREFPNQGVNKTDEYAGLSANTPTTYGRQMMY